MLVVYETTPPSSYLCDSLIATNTNPTITDALILLLLQCVNHCRMWRLIVGNKVEANMWWGRDIQSANARLLISFIYLELTLQRQVVFRFKSPSTLKIKTNLYLKFTNKHFVESTFHPQNKVRTNIDGSANKRSWSVGGEGGHWKVYLHLKSDFHELNSLAFEGFSVPPSSLSAFTHDSDS